jgi:hypothetical protein
MLVRLYKYRAVPRRDGDVSLLTVNLAVILALSGFFQ